MRVMVSSTSDPDLYDKSEDPFTVRCPRIQFQPGAISATATGMLPAGGSYRYVLEASSGQAMEINVSPPSLEVDVWGAAEGSTWQIPAGQGTLSVPTLPATQEYFVTLTNTSSTEGVSYVLNVTIR